MYRVRLIIAAWLLLLVPTLLVGGMALRLLKREQQQLTADTRAAALQRAQSTAETLDLALEEVRRGLLSGLRQLPEDDLAQHLINWRYDNPLIRNVFIWTPEGLILPDPKHPGNSEEAGFLSRFDALFQGRIPWQEPPEEAGSVEDGGGSAFLSPRMELRRLADYPLRSEGLSKAEQKLQTGWLPWFWEDGLYLLGWMEMPAGSGRRVGVEVEIMALLSRLLPTLPKAVPGEVWTLVDDHGRIVHQSGNGRLQAGTLPLATLPVGSGLPHWQLRIFSPEKAGGGGKTGLRLLSFLLVGSFVASILFGGSLLLWQAWRHMLDARRKTSFVANVSHELKTPLTTIRLYAELLLEGNISQPDRQQHYLQVIVGESQRLTRLVNNVLDLGRLDQERKKYRLEIFCPKDLVEDIFCSQKICLEQAGLHPVCLITEPVSRVKADPDAIRQVLLNLFDNVTKYATPGELVVEIKRVNNHCRIAVKDRGPGIPPGHREAIFTPFHRIDDSLTAACSGSGLGLSISRRLLTGMGGDLRFRPRRNGGSSFEIFLPLDPDEGIVQIV
ncbi:MAG: HAMP domain-containing sensor histidine kinase [Syntrophotaleaceae bacterium]